jgi:hypothetical protein
MRLGSNMLKDIYRSHLADEWLEWEPPLVKDGGARYYRVILVILLVIRTSASSYNSYFVTVPTNQIRGVIRSR